ncbi:hypothetical protein [Flavobacterium koreense]
MNKRITILIFLFYNFNLSAQEKLIVDKQNSEFYTVTGNKDYNKYFTDLKQIPNNIKYNLENYLNIILENIDSKAEFKDGCVSNLEDYFKENSKTYDRGWIVYKYQFVYRISMPEIGIKSYLIKIDMDEYGQILKCNWPREWFREPNRFIDRIEIEKTALKWSEQNSFPTSELYEIDFHFNEKHNALCWVFKFPTNKSKTKYIVIEIDWQENKIVEEYAITKTISY